jgi:Na+/H+-dicarboxylate symporter
VTETDPKLANRILAGLVVGVVGGAAMLALGAVHPSWLDGARLLSVKILDPVGQIFLRMLFFVVIPLVFASLAGGVLQLGELGRLGPLALRTFALFFLNMSIAVALGLVTMHVLDPGAQIDGATRAKLVAEFGGAARQHIATAAASPAMNFAAIVDMLCSARPGCGSIRSGACGCRRGSRRLRSS